MTTAPTLGIDPGANTGLVLAQSAGPGAPRAYEVVEHVTITTDTKASVADRLAAYGQAVESYATRYKPGLAVVEVPYRYARDSGRMSVWTHDGKNVASLCLLSMTTGSIFYALFRAGVPVRAVPSPIGRLKKKYAEMCQAEGKMLTGLALNEHEAVALALALSGIRR